MEKLWEMLDSFAEPFDRAIWISKKWNFFDCFLITGSIKKSIDENRWHGLLCKYSSEINDLVKYVKEKITKTFTRDLFYNGKSVYNFELDQIVSSVMNNYQNNYYFEVLHRWDFESRRYCANKQIQLLGYSIYGLPYSDDNGYPDSVEKYYNEKRQPDINDDKILCYIYQDIFQKIKFQVDSIADRRVVRKTPEWQIPQHTVDMYHNKCWNCHTPIHEIKFSSSAYCSKCKHYHCSKCGACFCGYHTPDGI